MTRKIIVSGPGTGKTLTLKQLLKNKDGNCLALTFINNLAQKLKHDLGGSAKTCTFHSYCKELLHKIDKDDLSDNFILFPKLEIIIKADAKILYDKQPNFSKCFRPIDLTNKNISFFLKRSSYYDAVSFDDSVSKFIREKFNDPSYERFCLSFCSRCTLVITRAIEDLISRAQQIGKQKARIDKQYTCYLPDKWSDSKKYPKITHAHCSVQSNKAPYIAKFILSEIEKLSDDEIKAAN